jgi:hypothetical protein
MADTPTADILQNLKGVLNKVMGGSRVSKKYTDALEVAIAQLELETIFVESECFRVDVESYDTGIRISVATSDGELLEEYDYQNGDIINDEQSGEA